MISLGDVWYELMPYPRLLKFNRVVAARLAPAKPGEPEPDGAREARWATLGRDKLLPLLADEWERAKSLDEKLFKATTALSVAVTAAGVASKAVLDALPTGPIKIGLMVVLLYAILSLFSGALMGFSGLRPKQRAGYGPDFAVRIRHDNKAAAAAIADALTHFEITNILRANEATAANMAIRNGVVAFALAMTFSLFIPAKKPEAPAPGVIDERSYTVMAPVTPPPSPPRSPPPVHPEPKIVPPPQAASRQAAPEPVAAKDQ